MGALSKQDFQRLFSPPPGVVAKIELYHDLLMKWQKAINLVSPKTIPEAWGRHFIDSAQISEMITQNRIVADLGCGAGFPGLVLAIMRPDLTVHLVESDERKGQFMRTVSRETQTKNVHIHTQRIEDVTRDFVPDVVTARALASLRELLQYCAPWVESQSDLKMIFLKGKAAQEEIRDAQSLFSFEHKAALSLSDPEACILEILNMRGL